MGVAGLDHGPDDTELHRPTKTEVPRLAGWPRDGGRSDSERHEPRDGSADGRRTDAAVPSFVGAVSRLRVPSSLSGGRRHATRHNPRVDAKLKGASPLPRPNPKQSSICAVDQVAMREPTTAQIGKSGALPEGGIAAVSRERTMTQRVKSLAPPCCFDVMLVNQEGDDTRRPIDRAAAAIRSS